MERFGVHLLALLLFSVLCVSSSLALPPKFFQPRRPSRQVGVGGAWGPSQETQELQEPPAQHINTVSVTCHPDSLEVTVQADMFGMGAPVASREVRLGVAHDDACRATPSSADTYRIVAGLTECGTKYWMTKDSLIYTNLLIYSPEASPDGLIRMEEAVIPIECHYERRYSLSSSSLTPTWIPFTSTQASVELLDFKLSLMTPDWLYERGSNVYYLGEPIGMEASVLVGHHTGLKVFVSSCVATLTPDMHSTPRYTFVEQGCLLDSRLPGSRAHFLPRTEDDHLRLAIDAFKFHDEDQGQLYITCHLSAVPADDLEAQDKACTFVNGRWRSADGNDYLCGYCPGQNEAGQFHAKLGPRARPEDETTQWRSRVTPDKVWEKKASVGPMLVLPGRAKSLPLPDEDLPPFIQKYSRPTQYGSQWRSGLSHLRDLEKGLVPVRPDSDQVEDFEKNENSSSSVDLSTSGKDLMDEDEYADNEVEELEETEPVSSKEESDGNSAASEVTPTLLPELDVTMATNMTTAHTDASLPIDPKRK